MSTATPPIPAIPQLFAAGNQAITSIVDPLAGAQALPETGENSLFTHVLSQFIQNNNEAAPVPGFLTALQGESLEQVLPEQGSILPLEGKLLPQNLLVSSEIGIEGLMDMAQPVTLQEPAYTADQDPLGLVTGLIRQQQGEAAIHPLPSGQSAQPQASAMLAAVTQNRTAADPAALAAETNNLQQIKDSVSIDLGDAAMQQDGEHGRKDNFLQGMQEMRLTSQSQAISDTTHQALTANREAVTNLMNTVTTPVTVLPDTAKPASMPILSLQQSLGRPEWRDEMASRVSMLIRNDQSVARLRINPAHLGPMEIGIKMSQDQASVSFVSQHMQVREAVELAIPRLREMLEQQGLNLADVDVSSGHSNAGHSASGSGDDADVSANQQMHNGSDSADPASADSIHTQSAEMDLDQAIGLLDEYV